MFFSREAASTDPFELAVGKHRQAATSDENVLC